MKRAVVIWGNMVLKNEDRYVYFAILSVIEFLDKIIIYDTGSTDKTVEIIKFLKKKYPKKIIFKEMGDVDAKGLTKLRQKMLDETTSDWILIVDGDEVWWEESLRRVVKKISEKNNLYALVNPVINLVRDIYHCQDEEAGNYRILGKKGHFNIRAINRKTKGLQIKGDYPLEGFYDFEDNLIQNMDEKLIFVDAPYLHFTHLVRSSNLQIKNVLFRNKFKFEFGKSFKENFEYPEALFERHPDIVSDPWQKSSAYFKIRATIETPLKKVKRKLFKK